MAIFKDLKVNGNISLNNSINDISLLSSAMYKKNIQSSHIFSQNRFDIDNFDTFRIEINKGTISLGDPGSQDARTLYFTSSKNEIAKNCKLKLKAIFDGDIKFFGKNYTTTHKSFNFHVFSSNINYSSDIKKQSFSKYNIYSVSVKR